MRIHTLPGVFSPRSDSWLLARTAAAHVGPRSRVLDVCTGSGVIACTAAAAGARRVVAVDVSRRAVLTVRMNARLNGVHVEAKRGDLLAPVAGERFDLIVSNPPYIPAPEEELPRRGERRAWDAGTDGRVVLDRICQEAPNLLSPDGVLLLVHSSICGEATTLAQLAAAGLDAEVAVRQRGPLGPIVEGRRAMLEDRGLLPRGATEEDVIIVRARRPRTSVLPGRKQVRGTDSQTA
ncbi:HemK2/MTQ2 family protein methyltransferase [Conexibacter sp. SYSU D00693]|uniref:HemK2/MTQ2 family protein methyltransferase n=1 Tax=Conexibacter sp. SYSU D00693 TaxID=2812560 RepID=UPI00196B3BE3|nr:HemK2/MTQ2 family protein methyltransferase [Conexibacter sp. SYSU D00693]